MQKLSSRGRMRKLMEFVGFVVGSSGIMGLVHEWTGWSHVHGLLVRLPVFDGYELYASVVFTMLGIALLVATDRMKRTERDVHPVKPAGN
ncbi:hypothetical protein ACWCP6_14470 [Streptomyces sp. NPDC002004]